MRHVIFHLSHLLLHIKVGAFISLFFSYQSHPARNLDSLRRIAATAKGKDQAMATVKYADLYYMINEDTSFKYAKIGFELSKRASLPNYAGAAANVIACILMNKGHYEEAMSKFIEAENIYTTKSGKAQIAMNIAGLYNKEGLYKKAREQAIKAIKLSRLANAIDFEAGSYSNLGSTYYSDGDDMKSLESFEKALELYLQCENKWGAMECLNNTAVIYWEMGKYEQALKNFKASAAYMRHQADKSGLLGPLHNIGLVYMDQGKYELAVRYVDSAIQIAKEIRDFNDLREAYASQSEIFGKKGDYKKALELAQLSAAAKDSLLHYTRQQQFIEMSTKYETEKKETENKLLKSESEKQKSILLGTGGGLALMFALVFIIAGNYRRKKKSNQLLSLQNTEIAAQKSIIEEKQSEIIDSINYARRLQDAILPPVGTIKENFEAEVLYKPKDIVAGDFYWFEKSGDTFFIAAADCTGHGVPGALVSVVCSNALNAAVHECNLKEPGGILDKTRELVLNTFAKSDNNVRDGMDISLLAVERDAGNKTIALRWAGANNSLYVLSSGRLTEIKGDKFHVGALAGEKLQNFTTHDLQLMAGSRYFLFSDGFADQFGGPKNKKYKYSRLKEKLLQSAQLSLPEQMAFLQSDLKAWQGKLEQVDDVLIIGLCV